MISASEEIGHVRPMLVAAVIRLQADGLPLMDAYAALGRQIGKSERWVRKVIGRDESAAIRLRDAWNIEAAYERLCARIDGVSERIEASAERMRETRDAAGTGAAAPRASDPGLVSRVADEVGQ